MATATRPPVPPTAHPNTQPAVLPAARRSPRSLGLLLSVLLLLAPVALLAGLLLDRFTGDEQAVTTMVAANALYTGGQYDLAAQAYAQLQAQGRGGQALLYNHGLALLYAGRSAEADALLQRARALYPRDESIRLALAEARRMDAGQAAAAPVELAPAVMPVPGLARLRADWVAADELAALALLLWTGCAALVLAAVRAPRLATRRLAAIGAVAAGLLLSAALLLLLA